MSEIQDIEDKYFYTDESGLPYDEEAESHERTEEDEEFLRWMLEKYGS